MEEDSVAFGFESRARGPRLDGKGEAGGAEAEYVAHRIDRSMWSGCDL
jgi:hypothetical protein